MGGKAGTAHHLSLELIDVTADTVDKTGFFCYMSKKKSPGYARKLAWTKERLAEGMRIKILTGGGRGFIEYIPGEYAWRAVDAAGYMFIHCIWVVGKSRHGQGQGTFLLEQCIADAQRDRMRGVAMLTTKGVWLANSRLLEKNGFVKVDEGPPDFTLWARKFQSTAPDPRLPTDWRSRWQRHPSGLTVFRSDQCPYVEDAADTMVAAAEKRQLATKIVELESAAQLRAESPTPYGIFGAVHDGKLFSYQYVLEKDFDKQLAAAGNQTWTR